MGFTMKITRRKLTRNIVITSEGGALYVDILGIGDLTKGKIPLSNDTVSAIRQLRSVSQEYIHQYFSVYLLTNFRNILASIKKVYPSINITQLSDCAFLWCTDLKVLIDAASRLMLDLIKKGIFCRGGLGYGEILVPSDDKNEELGRFVMGSAVTNAAIFEKLGKGCRIFTHPDFAREVGSLYGRSIFYPFLFHPPLADAAKAGKKKISILHRGEVDNGKLSRQGTYTKGPFKEGEIYGRTRPR